MQMTYIDSRVFVQSTQSTSALCCRLQFSTRFSLPYKDCWLRALPDEGKVTPPPPLLRSQIDQTVSTILQINNLLKQHLRYKELKLKSGLGQNCALERATGYKPQVIQCSADPLIPLRVSGLATFDGNQYKTNPFFKKNCTIFSF